jgi:hypothetical protein
MNDRKRRIVFMARDRSSEQTAVSPLGVVRELQQVASGDPAFRDIYLQRAAGLLEPVLPRAEYERLRAQESEIKTLLARTRRATQAQDWAQVKQLSARASALRGKMTEKAAEREAAAAVYDPADVVLDRFSVGLDVVASKSQESPEAIRDAVVTSLARLEKMDPEWSDLYEQRRSHFAALSVRAAAGTTEATTGAGGDARHLEIEAMRAAERGDLERLNQLAGEMLNKSAQPAEGAAPGAEVKKGTIIKRELSKLGEPISAPAIERGRSLGLALVEAKLTRPALRDVLTVFTERFVWHPGLPPGELARQGVSHLGPLLHEVDLPAELREPLLEAFALFALHPYVTSAGARYLPVFADSEFVLVEDFPEESPPSESALLSALGLGRRDGLSRVEIERALLSRGPQIVSDQLGLDARAFRLICIPFDIYVRLGEERGWGRQPHWTHVDGYQVLKDGQCRALVSGDVRYGGLLDLCSIGISDPREGVSVRFAVVRRQRLMDS